MWHTISDTHFQNSNIIKYCNRPFADAADQTEQLIRNWNSVVGEKDRVIHCGDFIMGNPDGIEDILSRLNGYIILVRGNHDTDRKLDLYVEKYSDKIIGIHNVYYQMHQGFWYVFCHFPLVNPDFGKMVAATHQDVVYVHGHVHDKSPFVNPELHAFNVSSDVVAHTPVSLHTLSALASQFKGRDS